MTKRILKLLIASIILIVLGGILAIIFNPETKVSKVELNNQVSTYSLVETVAPNSLNQVAVKLNLTGPRYIKRSHHSGRPSHRRSYTRYLAYEIPIAVKVTRVRDGAVLVNQNHVFALDPAEKARVFHKDNEIKRPGEIYSFQSDLRNMVGYYPEIPSLESPEELRIDLTLEKDKTYGAWLESGTLEINQKEDGVVHSIGLKMVFLGVLSSMLFALFLFIRLLIYTFSKPKRPV